MDGNQEKNKMECRSKGKVLANEAQDTLSTALNRFIKVWQTKDVASSQGLCLMLLSFRLVNQSSFWPGAARHNIRVQSNGLDSCYRNQINF